VSAERRALCEPATTNAECSAFVTAFAGAIELCRPLNVVIAAAAILVGGRFAGAAIAALAPLLPPATFLLAAGYAWNDVEDADRDRVSHARRPIPAKRLSARAASLVAAALFAVGIALTLVVPVSPLARTMLLVWALLLLSYRRIASRAPVLKGIVASGLTASALLLGGSAGRAPEAAFFPAAFAFLLTWVREMVKDLGDRAGDRAVGRPSWIDSLRPAHARAFIAASAASILLLIPMPAIFMGYGALYLAVAAFGVGVTLVVLCRDLSRLVPNESVGALARPANRALPAPAPFVRASRMLKASMIAGLFALLLGATGGGAG
jgi:4-hydroxybenzoate polyprenyltransferase